MSIPVGEAACLGAALLWAGSLQLFAGPIARHGARAVNLFKCTFATVLLGLTLLATGGWSAMEGASGVNLLLVALSGIVGLTIGDTALFGAVNRIGTHRSLLLQTTAPVFAVGLAWPLGERLNTGQWVGALVIFLGVVIVLSGDHTVASDTGSRRGIGVIIGLVAALGQGAGVVIAKAGMATVPVLPATFVRLGVGALGLIFIALATSGLGRTIQACSDRSSLPRLAIASLFGTYLAMLLMMTGVAWAPASVAAVLLATPPIFSLILESVIGRRWPSARGLAGTVIAVIGVALLATSG
ncbi:MAG: DMT family transporter [Thermoanaerobaculales bacterium]|nr:DMT family transporter [Thermoanaerobaculales bacterium]